RRPGCADESRAGLHEGAVFCRGCLDHLVDDGEIHVCRPLEADTAPAQVRLWQPIDPWLDADRRGVKRDICLVRRDTEDEPLALALAGAAIVVATVGEEAPFDVATEGGRDGADPCIDRRDVA